MKYKSLHCDLLKNKLLFDFVLKLFYLILKKLISLNIPNITSYLNIHLLDHKFTKEKIIKTNGLNCKRTNLCESLL